jgi:N-acetyl-gamma-glutamyl-phosphate reductase
MNRIRIGIVGGAGYTGGELIRLLINHPHAELSFIHSRSSAGQPVHSVHRELLGDTDLLFSNELHDAIDVLFLCVGHGEARKFLVENKIADSVRIIDLSQDFRLNLQSQIVNRKFVYGLPELNREQIRQSSNIANPGCFATAIQLGLLPLAKNGLLRTEVNTTGITGSTGAGQALASTSHFSWRESNIQAYKTLRHQHMHEIGETLMNESNGAPEIYFTPWRGDFTRGIFVTSVLTMTEKLETYVDVYRQFYELHPFTILSQDEIYLKQVINTNKCVIHLEKAGTKLVVHSAIDNLLKGASGQAVQNMNLMFELDERAGLALKPSAF